MSVADFLCDSCQTVLTKLNAIRRILDQARVLETSGEKWGTKDLMNWLDVVEAAGDGLEKHEESDDWELEGEEDDE